jgi:hypothetical protein
MARYFLMSDFAGFPAGTEIIPVREHIADSLFDRVQAVGSSFTFSPPKHIIFTVLRGDEGKMDCACFMDGKGRFAGAFDVVALVIQLAEARQQLKDLQNAT